MSAEIITSPEHLSPIFTSFETIFDALGEPLPKPDLFMQLGYESSEFDVRPYLRASFKGSFLKASVTDFLDVETKDEILKLAEEQVNNFSHEDRYNQLREPIKGKIVVEAGSARVSEQWRLLYPEGAVDSVFRDNLSFDSEEVSYSLGILAPDKFRPSHDSLNVKFPENNLHEFNLLTPLVDFQKISGPQTVLTRKYRQRVCIFAQAISRELKPVWQYWHKLQIHRYQYNLKALEILVEAYDEADENLRLAADLLNE